MRFCERCRRRFYDDTARYCPFDGLGLQAPDGVPHPALCGEGSAPQTDVPGLSASRSAAGSDVHLGQVLLGQFRLDTVIGHGAMGTVYRAWQSGMERQVAVKLLRGDLVGDERLRARFLREARAAARLAHPNIVGVHLVGETPDGVPYLVMEYLPGANLEDVLSGEGRFAPRRAAAIARQIAWALAQAHAAGVIHRDLKPANIMLVDRRGTGELVKILDFGIAKVTGHPLLAGQPTALTRQGTVFGTPHYISPEQAQCGNVDGRSDVYSLGVLMYRMVCGRLPFDGSAMAVMLAHIAHQPPAIDDPDVDDELAELIMSCLAKDPDQRPHSADQVATRLECYLSAAPGPRNRRVLARGSRPRRRGRPAGHLTAVPDAL